MIVETPPGSSLPAVSILLAIDQQRERGAAALESILAQEGIDECEVLVFDFGAKEHQPIHGSSRAGVWTIPMLHGWSTGWWRALAVRVARGQVVAFVEEHARPLPGWLPALRKLFAGGAAGVSGPPISANAGHPVGDLVQLVGYYPFLNIRETTDVPLLPGQNSAYRRDLLVETGALLPRLIATEPVLNYYLTSQGHRLVMDASVSWSHINETSLLGAARGHFLYNRILGADLGWIRHWSRTRRFLMFCRIPLQPFVRILKISYQIGRGGRSAGPFFRMLPAAFLVLSAGALGQARGMAFGRGSAEVEFLRSEINEDR